MFVPDLVFSEWANEHNWGSPPVWPSADNDLIMKWIYWRKQIVEQKTWFAVGLYPRNFTACVCLRLTGVFVTMATGRLWRHGDRWRWGGWLSVKHKSAGCIQVPQVRTSLCTLSSPSSALRLHLGRSSTFRNTFYITIRALGCVPEPMWPSLEGCDRRASSTWTHENMRTCFIIHRLRWDDTPAAAERQPPWPQVSVAQDRGHHMQSCESHCGVLFPPSASHFHVLFIRERILFLPPKM